MYYRIVSIPPDAREDIEPLGSKTKFWISHEGKRWLFKETRPSTGEDWSEKVAAELAHAIGITAATVDLAEFSGRRGCISLNFVDVERGQALVHGNEALAETVTGYDKGKVFRQSDHTPGNIEAAVRKNLGAGSDITAALRQLAAYLVLDALIGNTDRHHENWGLFRAPAEPVTVAPSFDHASSLGRELSDEKRLILMKENRIQSYVEKGRGGVFLISDNHHGENPLKLVVQLARMRPSLFEDALRNAVSLPEDRIKEIVDAVPDERASILAKKFTKEMIFCAQKSLMEIGK